MFAESKRGPDSPRSRMERWTIDPVAGTTTRTVIHDHNQEFPRYDERRTTRPYRYIYSVALPAGAGELAIAHTRLFRPDLEKDRKSDVSGKSVSVRVALGGRRIIKKKK